MLFCLHRLIIEEMYRKIFFRIMYFYSQKKIFVERTKISFFRILNHFIRISLLFKLKLGF